MGDPGELTKRGFALIQTELGEFCQVYGSLLIGVIQMRRKI